MPMWLIQMARAALTAVGIGAAWQGGTELVGRFTDTGERGRPGGPPDEPGWFQSLLGAGQPPRRRPRRRKALTSDDVKLALTIASAISKKAAETFIAQRVRAG